MNPRLWKLQCKTNFTQNEHQKYATKTSLLEENEVNEIGHNQTHCKEGEEQDLSSYTVKYISTSIIKLIKDW